MNRASGVSVVISVDGFGVVQDEIVSHKRVASWQFGWSDEDISKAASTFNAVSSGLEIDKRHDIPDDDDTCIPKWTLLFVPVSRTAGQHDSAVVTDTGRSVAKRSSLVCKLLAEIA